MIIRNIRITNGDPDYHFQKAQTSSEPAFLKRICVNFLRHMCTEYEYTLHAMIGKVGKYDAYHRLRTRIFEAIKRTYPWLSDECDRQDS